MSPHIHRDPLRRDETPYRDALAAAHARIQTLERERHGADSRDAAIDDDGLLRVAIGLLLVAAGAAVAFGAWCLLD